MAESENGKIIQVLMDCRNNTFEIKDGIPEVDFIRSFGLKLDFADVNFGNLTPGMTTTYISGKYLIDKRDDGKTIITVYNGDLSENDKEDYLMVIIPESDLTKTDAEILAGSQYDGSILVMKPGNYVQLLKPLPCEEEELYICIAVGNELFLVRKRR